MIKLPARDDGQWTVSLSSDKLPDLHATRNLSFDKEGYLRLSKPVISFYNSDEDADFGVPIYFGKIVDGQYLVCTDEAQFDLDFLNGLSAQGGYLECSQNAGTGTPTATQKTDPGACFFNDDLCYTTETELYTHALGSLSGSWTDRNISANLDANDFHPVAHFVSQNGLAIGNDDDVKLFDTSFTLDTTLQLPSDYQVTGVAYNNSWLGITTRDEENLGHGKFFVWDGNASSANYSYDIGASACSSPIPYRGSFVILSGTGQLLYWTPQRLEVIAEFPSYFSSGQFFVSHTACNRNESIWVSGDVIYINVDSVWSGRNEELELFKAEQPGGVWCYDPAVGLYHRHAPTARYVTSEVIATSAVDTTDDEITVASAPETGTPVRYSSSTALSSDDIGGLTNASLYYTIKVDATTIQLASTYQDSLDGTAIDLTDTGNNNQTLQFYPKSDFGQSLINGQQGCVYKEESTSNKAIYTQGLMFGSNCASTTTTEKDTGCFALIDSENRGHFITAKMRSSGLQDDWQKVYLKHSELVNDTDKIVIKYRTLDEKPLVKIFNTSTSGDGVITWTDSDTFTTTDTQFASVIAGDEVEIIQGTGSGYLAHISSIAEAGGTYTVNLDESIKNLTASDTGRVVVSRWTKLTTIDKDTVRNSDGYSEVPIGTKSKQIQFKVELRGEDIEVEELLVANELSKTV